MKRCSVLITRPSSKYPYEPAIETRTGVIVQEGDAMVKVNFSGFEIDKGEWIPRHSPRCRVVVDSEFKT